MVAAFAPCFSPEKITESPGFGNPKEMGKFPIDEVPGD
jgi:hypothetical protein